MIHTNKIDQAESSRIDMDANKRRRLHALQSVSQLHPLSLECVHTADALVQDLAKEVAEEALLVAGGVVTCSEEVKALLEGARGTLPNGDEKVSKPLFALLSEEAAKISAERSAAQKALAPGAAAGPGADVFGNRLTKQAAAAETIICTNCGTSLTANRYAPHLERCMLGKGRASARQARDAMRAKEVPLQSAL
jgi:hypothetical protein